MAKILVAEDEPAVREFVSRALQQGGHEVTAVEDGLAALQALGDETFELLLTDIRMPRLDGITLALKVAKDHPNVTILMMTGYASEEQRAHNLNRLIHRVVSKPFTLEEICTAADEALASGPAPAA